MGYISKRYNIDSETVAQMVRDGIIDWRLEGLYNFWVFYNELLKKRETKREAKKEIMMHYSMPKSTFYYNVNKAKKIFGKNPT